MKRPKHAPFLPATRPGSALAFDLGTLLLAQRGQPLAFSLPAPIRFYPEDVTDDRGVFHASSILPGGIGVLSLTGPIEHHADFFWHNYEDLSAEVARALDCNEVKALVLKIDSPGGIAAGMSESHKAIRAMRKEFGKPIVAYVDEMACSAAYHIASACDEIWGPESMHVGSVGVILCTIDETAALEKAGLAVRYVVSGARKADLHPGQPVDDKVIKVAQAKVDILAQQFFSLVAKSRKRNGPLATPEDVEALQAAVFVGADAVKVGLADGVASWARFLALLRGTISASREVTDPSVSRARTPGARARR
jgi:signal peptide peptidase SppA